MTKIQWVLALGNLALQEQYRGTRHNAASDLGLVLKGKSAPIYSDTTHSVWYLNDIGYLLLLNCGINNSGPYLSEAIKLYKIAIKTLVVLVDCIETAYGSIKCVFNASNPSSKGHNGIKSIVNTLGLAAFDRVRIGVGRKYKPNQLEISDYVLGKHTHEESLLLYQCYDSLIHTLKLRKNES